MDDNQKNEYLEFAKAVALEAGEIMRHYFGKQPASHFKQDNTIVTIADEEVNELVIQRVHALYPSHDIDGEEASSKTGSSYLWVCDPIDGTSPFSMEIPVSVFSLALVVDGRPEVGVVYAPFSEHLYWATTGGGAFCNGGPIKVSDLTLRSRAVMNIDWWPSAPWDAMAAVHKLAYENNIYITTPGSTTHAAAIVARGGFVASVFVGTRGKNVDIAAVKVIVEEAGGRVTDLFGEEQRYDDDIRGAIVSNGIVHDEIVKAMKGLL